MAIYKLTPLNPTNSVWRQFPFVETVWTNARDEHEARICVSEVAHQINPGLLGPMNCWPWVYFARCTADEPQFSIGRGEVVNCLGRFFWEGSQLPALPQPDWDAWLKKVTLARDQFAALAHGRVTAKEEERLSSYKYARLARAAQPEPANAVSNRGRQRQRRDMDAA